MMTLVLGGARSGKSRYAEDLVTTLSKASNDHSVVDVMYVATATADDAEMQQRIAHHQATRESSWQTLEEPLQLSSAINRIVSKPVGGYPVLLIDCMTLWLSNWLCAYSTGQWVLERDKFLAEVSRYPGDVVIVSNEVGSGIVPMGELSRLFVDHAGWLNQALAKMADRSLLVVAGLPLELKNNAAFD